MVRTPTKPAAVGGDPPTGTAARAEVAPKAPIEFPQRLYAALGGRYDAAMRRSVQTAVLYEASRCLHDRFPSLRPFQRKIALFDTASHLVNMLEFIPLASRGHVLHRTASSKLPLSPELAWRRMKLIDREINKLIIPKIAQFVGNGRTHDETCEAFIQSEYEQVSGAKGRPHPPMWEHGHLNVFIAYRLYYKGEAIDSSLAPSKPPKEIVVPAKKPDGQDNTNYLLYSHAASMGPSNATATTGKSQDIKAENPDEDDKHSINIEDIVNPEEEPEGRRSTLKEVREHLDLLKEFEGVIPQDELVKRKRELFLALPPAPPSAAKKPKRDDEKRVKAENEEEV